MSLTRKHFQAVADILRDERESLQRYRETACPALPRAGEIKAEAMALQMDRIEDRLIAYFRTENPQFDSARFRRAAR